MDRILALHMAAFHPHHPIWSPVLAMILLEQSNKSLINLEVFPKQTESVGLVVREMKTIPAL